MNNYTAAAIKTTTHYIGTYPLTPAQADRLVQVVHDHRDCTVLAERSVDHARCFKVSAEHYSWWTKKDYESLTDFVEGVARTFQYPPVDEIEGAVLWNLHQREAAHVSQG